MALVRYQNCSQKELITLVLSNPFSCQHYGNYSSLKLLEMPRKVKRLSCSVILNENYRLKLKNQNTLRSQSDDSKSLWKKVFSTITIKLLFFTNLYQDCYQPQ